jgi:hypothetical protein
LGENEVRSETGEILLRLPDGRLISPVVPGIGTNSTFMGGQFLTGGVGGIQAGPTQIGLQPGGTGQPLGENMVRSETGEVLLRLPDGRLISPTAPGIGTNSTFMGGQFLTGGVGGIQAGSGGTFQAPTFPTYTPPVPMGLSGLPEARGTGGGESRIDPALRPYLELGLRRGEQLFFGDQQPQFYPGQTYVSPSQQTLDALQAQEQIARGAQPTLQSAQQAYQQAMSGVGFTAGGGFLQGSPFRDMAIQSAVRPLMQQFEQTTLPGIQSAFSRAGRYGSGAQERAIGQATEATGRAIGDISSQIAAADFARERGLQEAALARQAGLAGLSPELYQQQFLPSQQLAQVGAAREQISAMPLQEDIQRFQFQQRLPYEQFASFLSGVYGTPLAASQYQQQAQPGVNRTAQNLGILSTIGGLIPERQRSQALDYIFDIF